jgi:hypothetical protein
VVRRVSRVSRGGVRRLGRDIIKRPAKWKAASPPTHGCQMPAASWDSSAAGWVIWNSWMELGVDVVWDACMGQFDGRYRYKAGSKLARSISSVTGLAVSSEPGLAASRELWGSFGGSAPVVTTPLWGLSGETVQGSRLAAGSETFGRVRLTKMGGRASDGLAFDQPIGHSALSTGQ